MKDAVGIFAAVLVIIGIATCSHDIPKLSSRAECGDGLVQGEEHCDDGNLLEDDGCNSACQVESGWVCDGAPTECSSYCGDAIEVGEEECDDGNSDPCDGCLSNCTTIAAYSCGDGHVCGNDQCDDGNNETEACNYGLTSCSVCGIGCIYTEGLPSYCGDGHYEPAREECDDGSESSDCDTDCTTTSCGDGMVNHFAGELCDDGLSDDCLGTCSSDCQALLALVPDSDEDSLNDRCDPCTDADGDGYGLGPSCLGADCHDGNSEVHAQQCGDGHRCGTEVCDEGHANSDSWSMTRHCRIDCLGFSPHCGDGTKDTDEQCDDSNSDSVDGCSKICLVESGWACHEGGTACFNLLQWAKLEAGSFTMGSLVGEPERNPDEAAHLVTLTGSFLMMRHEVTQGQFQAMLGFNPSQFSSCGSTCPTETISWYDALAYANESSRARRLSPCYALTDVMCTNNTSVGDNYMACFDTTHFGIKSATVSLAGTSSTYACQGIRLPTEAEWEYAARAGSSTPFYPSAGNDGTLLVTDDCPAIDPNASQIAVYCTNASQPVGTKAPNQWGLYDMSGNVYEWAWDHYCVSYQADAATDPQGAACANTEHTIRGGSWEQSAIYCCSSVAIRGSCLQAKS